MKIILYSGPDCELCDYAIATIKQLEGHIEIEKVNVRDSSELYHLYGARIPVIKKNNDAQVASACNASNNSSHSSLDELGWPFSLTQLKAFLA
jgi:hypothetical protein